MSITVRKDAKARRFEMTIDVDALPDAVWSALTEAEELTRWFPLEARVVPGEGGSMSWGWGEGWAGESKIAAWEPNRRLKLIETRQGFDADGKPLADPNQDRQLIVEVTLESAAGKTRVRLVHSGFGEGTNWDDELDGISNGWQFELRGLRHYLERHRGRQRHHAWVHASSALTPAAIWQQLLAEDAFLLPQPWPAAGSPYSLVFERQRYSGVTMLAMPGDDFAGTVSELHDGVFRLETFRAAGKTGVVAWLASYDPGDVQKLKAFEEAARSFFERTFAAAARV
jgi:uncharacterized protein YndB with AHSA1/START domain